MANKKNQMKVCFYVPLICYNYNNNNERDSRIHMQQGGKVNTIHVSLVCTYVILFNLHFERIICIIMLAPTVNISMW